jgi:hypothetical protein
VPALGQSADALALRRLDTLRSIEAGAMGLSKDQRSLAVREPLGTLRE